MCEALPLPLVIFEMKAHDTKKSKIFSYARKYFASLWYGCWNHCTPLFTHWFVCAEFPLLSLTFWILPWFYLIWVYIYFFIPHSLLSDDPGCTLLIVMLAHFLVLPEQLMSHLSKEVVLGSSTLSHAGFQDKCIW